MDDLSERLERVQEAIAVARRTGRAGTGRHRADRGGPRRSRPTWSRRRCGPGCPFFGENKVQEARGKIEELGRGQPGT
ncbi:MAG: hypothetical protein WDO13_07595 [Verrucomicrobiota bacterium]